MSDSLKSDLFFGDGREHGGAARGFLVVGIGASAGGIQSLKEFFSRVPPDSGMAYVVILHLSPDYESRLAEVLQSATPLPVTQVKERVRVEPDHVYVISPNRSLAMVDGHLTLSAIKRVEERRAPVDIFFRTLAESKHERAVCVILSGTGADGSMGMKRIKETGGVCIVQDPAEAEYSDMPRNSVATGLVDYVLPVAEIPAKIVAYGKHLSSISGPAGPGERPESDGLALRDIFTQLRASAGHDFTNYKRSTVLRRVERRMSVNEVSDLPAYARFLREQADEPRALLKDLLISVTNFFRDPEPFRALEEKFVPRLFESKGAKDHVRAWAAGCATGEEAYSIAMLLSEFASDLASPPHVQVFATDIDEWAVAKAREGFYTLNDVADVSPGRLRRFFVKEDAGFRVRRELREMVLFAPHNLIKDPPFSHLDLVTCRNLLIYLNRTAQGRVMEVLHFSLNPGGYLFLGTAESVEGSGDLFVAADKESHIFQSRPAETRVTLPFMHALTATAPRPIPFRAEQERGREKRAEQITYLDLHQRLLEQYAPPSVVVNEEYEIVRLSESAGRYMQVAGGEPSNNLLRLVRPELRLELRAALYQAVQKRMNVEARDLEVDVDGKAARVNLQVRPVLRDDDATRGFILVIFEDGLGAWRGPDEALVARGEPMARQLEEELVRSKAQLSLSVEQYELQQEELKASNEELQAMNEELHSSAEELETSKEELQSLNEELTTVNQELKVKIEELSQSNNDILNLINSTDIGTVFLDRGLNVKLFTTPARAVFNLIPSDVGRPLSNITNRLGGADLIKDAEQVIDRLQTVEREAETDDGRWYLIRLSPYRTSEDLIRGVVMTFLEITERKRAEVELRESEERLRLIVGGVSEYAIITLDPDGRIVSWNVGAEHMFGYSAEEAIGQHTEIIFTPEDRERGVPGAEMLRAREEGRAPDERWHIGKSGRRFYVSGVMSSSGGITPTAYVKIARDLTENKRLEDALKRAYDEMEERVRDRTLELAEANVALQTEVRERRAAEEDIKRLLRQLVTVQEDERRRIARDLHDHLGQQLTALRLNLESLRQAPGKGKALVGKIEQAQALAERVDADVDFLAWELRPAALDDLGLNVALAHFLQEFSKHYNIPAQFHSTGLEKARLLPEVETNLYRIAQEALNNTCKHAQAGCVNVILEKRDGQVALIVEDDGRGFDLNPEAIPDGEDRGMGLLGMRERAAIVGGTLEIETAPGEGTTVFARVPAQFVKGE